MNDRIPMKYKVYTTRHPGTGKPYRRPIITDRTTLNLGDLVTYARSMGFVRGRQEDLEGLLQGFVEAMQDRAKAGCTINVNGWFKITGHLAGTVGADEQLTSANSYHVKIAASKELKVPIANFSWTKVEGGRPPADAAPEGGEGAR